MTPVEQDTHALAVMRCTEIADEMGGHMSCTDEYECPAPESCGHFLQAMLDVADRERRKDIGEQAMTPEKRAELRAKYDEVAEWPERRGDPMLVGGIGFLGLLELRNAVPALLDALDAAERNTREEIAQMIEATDDILELAQRSALARRIRGLGRME